ncbi:hypothetical protein E4U48_007332 [Claviceps purpurea]|nr:hypothetical protein E4U25_006805 [Claviceps purpurea]KAG6262304.1 hypothetical protein E4U48_007332 [Claviceps purpurea]
MHTQQARPAPGTDLQPPLAYRQLQQLPPKVMESQIPSTYEKKNMSVLREWSSQYCPVSKQPQHILQGKLLLTQLLHGTPMPTPRTEIRPAVLTSRQLPAPMTSSRVPPSPKLSLPPRTAPSPNFVTVPLETL